MYKQIVKAQNLATDATELVADKARNEEGEVASWLILAAGLTLAAFAASDHLIDVIDGLAQAVGARGAA